MHTETKTEREENPWKVITMCYKNYFFVSNAEKRIQKEKRSVSASEIAKICKTSLYFPVSTPHRRKRYKNKFMIKSITYIEYHLKLAQASTSLTVPFPWSFLYETQEPNAIILRVNLFRFLRPYSYFTWWKKKSNNLEPKGLSLLLRT